MYLCEKVGPIMWLCFNPHAEFVHMTAVREMARHRYRQSQFAGLTRLQLDEVGRERQVQQQGRQRAEALAERSVEIAQAMVPLAGALARGGG